MDWPNIKIGVVTLTVGHWDLMGPHIQSIYEHYPFPKEFYIIPNIDYGMSLSGAINKGFNRALNDECDFIVYCADDVILQGGCIQILIDNMMLYNTWMANGQHEGSSGWDLFVLNPIILSEVGFWDEDFYPAYFEDNDFARRLLMREQEIGQKKHVYIPVDFQHLGSQTLNRMTEYQRNQHHLNFDAVRNRYIAKWGGMPGEETFTIPFNGIPQ